MQNILMIHMESWDGRMLGCQGLHPAMADATPSIDALAARGARFANAYQRLLHESHLLPVSGEHALRDLHSRVRELEQLQGPRDRDVDL